MKIQKTKDGSHTLVSKEFGELYHSHNGSLQEANHIFIKNGIQMLPKEEVHIFEMGFGSGLNAILSYFYAKNNKLKIIYHGIEAFPVSIEIISQLNYNNYIQESDFDQVFQEMHLAPWNEMIEISNFFTLHKVRSKIESFSLENIPKVDIIFFDAFAPSAQSNLWEKEILTKMYLILKQGGFLISFCAQGAFKRTLKDIGFQVKGLPGPIGKREITRAEKPSVQR